MTATYLPLTEAARRIGRTVETLRRWITSGRLRAVRLPDANGRLHVLAADLHLERAEVAQGKPRTVRRPRRSKRELDAEEFLRSEGVIP